MRTNLLFLGTFLSLLLLCGCPVFVDTTPPVKKTIQQEPFHVPDSLYYYDPNYFSELDKSRPYQVPSGITVAGYTEQWVIAPEFAGASSLDQILWRITAYGWYCVTDSLCECIRTRVMYPGDIFHLADSDSFLVGQDRIYFGDSPWSVAKRIIQTDSLQEGWKEKQLIKMIESKKDSLLRVDSRIAIVEHEVQREKFQRYIIFGLGLLILFFSFYYRKELAMFFKKIT